MTIYFSHSQWFGVNSLQQRYITWNICGVNTDPLLHPSYAYTQLNIFVCAPPPLPSSGVYQLHTWFYEWGRDATRNAHCSMLCCVAYMCIEFSVTFCVPSFAWEALDYANFFCVFFLLLCKILKLFHRFRILFCLVWHCAWPPMREQQQRHCADDHGMGLWCYFFFSFTCLTELPFWATSTVGVLRQ